MGDEQSRTNVEESQPPEARQFDFLEGEWEAVCQSARPDGSWESGAGRLTATRILDGTASMEFFEGPYQGKVIKGLGLRAFNRTTKLWEHTWTDSSAPGGFVVWRGRFEGGSISLFGEWDDEHGRRVRSRLTWDSITERGAHWESHRSFDRGKTWTKHWVVDFRKKSG